MELSLFLAQLFGLTIMVFSAIAFFRPMLMDEVFRDIRPYSFAAMMAGFIGIVCGLAIILSHNIWEFSWRGLVTLFGWGALIKGVSYIAFPQVIISAANKFMMGRNNKLIMIVYFLVGCYLAYHGFGYGM